MKAEFDYQWGNLPTTLIDYTPARVNELLNFTGLPREFFKGKIALDAGCGNGRYTYAMMELGAKVMSIDISEEAIKKCSQINEWSMQTSIMELGAIPFFDFILSWGVLHHTENPHEGFVKLVSVLKPGGTLHLMLYNKKGQGRYTKLREQFKALDEAGRLKMAQGLAKKPEHVHGWYDALNPEYNYGYDPLEIYGWFKDIGFTDIKLVKEHNININGKLK